MEIEAKIREFVAQNLLFEEGPLALEDDASFLQQGVIDSLGVVELVSFVNREFGVQAGAGEVIPANFDSVLQLSGFIRRKLAAANANSACLSTGEGISAANYSSIVEIRRRSSDPPLFLVHGVGGGMLWGYSNLARHLGPDQPVYAFKSRGLDGLEEFTQVENMAAQYVADLRKFQPAGPYYLGGYCFGGNVAFEMARQLTAQNEKVALLLLINCWPNNSSYTKLSWSPAFFAKAFGNFCFRLGHQLRWGAKQPRDFFKWRAAWLRKRLKSLFSEKMSNQVAVEDIVDLSGRPEHERSLWRTHVHAWLQYQPQVYEGRVVLFRTRGHPVVCSFDHQMGWGPYAARGVLVKICPGDHETILEEENVAFAARELKTILAQTRASGTERRRVALPEMASAGILDSAVAS